MNYALSVLALAAPQAQQQGAQPNPLLAFAPIFFMFIIFYFLLIRPQQQKQKQHEATLNELKKGDKVITSGGIIGTVIGTKDKEVVIKVGEAETKLVLLKASISQIVTSS